MGFSLQAIADPALAGHVAAMSSFDGHRTVECGPRLGGQIFGEDDMHRPVLSKEAVDMLSVKRGGTYIDGTVGSGGHARSILDRIGPEGVLLGIDLDESAIGRAQRNLADSAGRCIFVNSNYARMAEIARGNGLARVDGIILDLGVSSDQLDTPGRGFSFMRDGPLDMRFSLSQETTAADLVNGLDEDELYNLLRDYGEERRARRIARAIVASSRQSAIATTGQLAEVIENAVGGRRGRLHPATRSFMAIRLAVNQELESLQTGLSCGLDLLSVGGRMAVITFHSLEDRLVKRFFALHAGRWQSLQAGGREWCGERPAVTRVTRKPVRPTLEETETNPRSRSAKLRVVERCE